MVFGYEVNLDNAEIGIGLINMESLVLEVAELRTLPGGRRGKPSGQLPGLSGIIIFGGIFFIICCFY